MCPPASRLKIRVLIKLKTSPHPAVYPITGEAAVGEIGIETIEIISNLGGPIIIDPVFQIQACQQVIVHFSINVDSPIVGGALELGEEISGQSWRDAVV